MTAVLHHHHDRDGRLIDTLAWRALRTQDQYCLLGQYSRATETIQAIWHGNGERYDFEVRILGGKHHSLVIQCSTEESTIWLFDLIVEYRKAEREWDWLQSVEAR